MVGEGDPEIKRRTGGNRIRIDFMTPASLIETGIKNGLARKSETVF